VSSRVCAVVVFVLLLPFSLLGVKLANVGCCCSSSCCVCVCLSE